MQFRSYFQDGRKQTRIFKSKKHGEKYNNIYKIKMKIKRQKQYLNTSKKKSKYV